MNSPNAIFRAVARAARRTPGAVAIRFRDRSWTYETLCAAAIALAGEMADEGVREGDRVAFLGRNSDAYAIGFLATQYIGAVHVPLNYMLGPAEVAYILDHSGPRLFFADPEYRKVAEDAVAQIAAAPLLRELAPPETCRAHHMDWGPDEPTIRPAQIAYTSGTESAPKGATLSDIGLVHQYMSCIAAGEYARGDVVVHALPLYHCAQLHCFLIPALMLGSENIILDRADPREICDTIAGYRATSFFAPPTVWLALLGIDDLAGKLATLSKGFYGASIMPTEVLQSLRVKVPALRLWNYYGQTEIGPLASVLRPEEHDARPASAGKPVLFVETRVVDDDMADTAPGEVGEIVHRSPQLLMHYHREPEKTAAAFLGGWFHSGDLAIRDAEGYITIVDRKKDMINSGGENVSSREVEEAIYAHPAVNEVAVVGLRDPKWVERVCAVVVLNAGFTADAAEIIAATHTLAPYKRPKQVAFLDMLPKNPSGKILKRDLRDALSQS